MSRTAAIEQQFVELVNAERRDRNLGTLSTNAKLVQVAREHCAEMCQKNYFDHRSPTPGYTTPMDRYIKDLGRMPAWTYLGENLFYCSTVDVDLGHSCLMNSPKHRENILNPRFREMGVGVYIGADGRFWVTQLFLTQID